MDTEGSYRQDQSFEKGRQQTLVCLKLIHLAISVYHLEGPSLFENNSIINAAIANLANTKVATTPLTPNSDFSSPRASKACFIQMKVAPQTKLPLVEQLSQFVAVVLYFQESRYC